MLAQDINNDDVTPSHTPNTKGNDGAYVIINRDTVVTIYAYLMIGIFPQCLSSGYQYIFVGYHYDGNIILVIPIKIECRQY